MSHEKFSIYHAGLRNVTGIGRVLSSCSRIRNCPKRFGRTDCAPIVERQTIFGGLALQRAERKAEIAARLSRKSGEGSKFGGSITKTPSASWNAVSSDFATYISATAISHPCFAQVPALLASRTTARTPQPFASNVLATAPPTCPVIPLTANINVLSCNEICSYHANR